MSKQSSGMGYGDRVPDRREANHETPEMMIPEAFRQMVALQSPADRYGVEGDIRLELDARVDHVDISYHDWLLQPELKQFFTDDHVRFFNDQLSKKGGRDMRSFEIGEKDPELATRIKKMRQERMTELQKEKDELVKALREQLAPCRITVEIFQQQRRVDVYNEGGDNDYHVSITPVIEWMVCLPGYSRNKGTSIIKKELSRASYDIGEEMPPKTQNAIQEALAEGNREATLFLQERLRALESIATAQVSALDALKKNIDEAAIFDSTYQVDVPIYLSKGLGREERDRLIADAIAQGEAPRVRYQKKRGYDPLENYGVKGTRAWYQAMGVNLDTDVVAFPEYDEERAKSDSLPWIADMTKRKQEKSRVSQEGNQGKATDNAVTSSRRQAEEAAAQAQATEAAKRIADAERITQELTPELRAKIEAELSDLEALGLILSTLPTTTPEAKIFIGRLPIALIRQLRSDYSAQRKGKELIADAEKIKNDYLRLMDQKKINQEIPKLKDRTLALLEDWHSIPERVQSDDAQIIILEGLFIRDGVPATDEALQQEISARFLKDPWHRTIEQAMNEVLSEIILADKKS
ncbi:MAG: hypothetical protein WC776_05220 [Patescibacteria group bacterium]|jgi:hypothetical protein